MSPSIYETLLDQVYAELDAGDLINASEKFWRAAESRDSAMMQTKASYEGFADSTNCFEAVTDF